MALAEFKIHLDLAAAGKIDPAVQPTALYLFHNDLVLTAIESGSYTPEKSAKFRFGSMRRTT